MPHTHTHVCMSMYISIFRILHIHLHMHTDIQHMYTYIVHIYIYIHMYIYIYVCIYIFIDEPTYIKRMTEGFEHCSDVFLVVKLLQKDDEPLLIVCVRSLLSCFFRKIGVSTIAHGNADLEGDFPCVHA